jgi:hypothetical protein
MRASRKQNFTRLESKTLDDQVLFHWFASAESRQLYRRYLALMRVINVRQCRRGLCSAPRRMQGDRVAIGITGNEEATEGTVGKRAEDCAAPLAQAPCCRPGRRAV